MIRIILLSLIIASALPAADPPDTVHLAATLKRVRGSPVIPAEEHQRIQTELVNWIGARVSVGVPVEQINQELRDARLLANRPQDFVKALDFNSAGYVDEVYRRDVRGADDIFAIEAVMGTGGYCGTDETAILFERTTGKRIGWVTGDRSFHGRFLLTGIAASKATAGETRIVATGWDTTNCTSCWNGKAIRIDTIAPDGRTSEVLNKGIPAYSCNREEVVAPWVQLDQVTFFYDRGSSINDLFISPGIAKYRIENHRAVRMAPLALNLAGFIDEWIDLTDDQARAWSSSGAAQSHPAIAARFRNHFPALESVTACPGQSWQVALRPDDHSPPVVFTIQAQRAKQLRMTAISADADRTCQLLPGQASLNRLRAELP